MKEVDDVFGGVVVWENVDFIVGGEIFFVIGLFLSVRLLIVLFYVGVRDMKSFLKIKSVLFCFLIIC